MAEIIKIKTESGKAAILHSLNNEDIENDKLIKEYLGDSCIEDFTVISLTRNTFLIFHKNDYIHSDTFDPIKHCLYKKPIEINGYIVIDDLGNGNYVVGDNEKYYYIYNSITNVYTEKYSKIEKFIDGLAIVRSIRGNYNFIDENGEILSSIWFSDVNKFIGDYAIVTYQIHDDSPYRLLRKDGYMIQSEFKEISKIFNNFPIIRRPNFWGIMKENYINLETGLELLESDVCRCSHFPKDGTIITIEDDNNIYQIDTNGNKTKLN